MNSVSLNSSVSTKKMKFSPVLFPSSSVPSKSASTISKDSAVLVAKRWATISIACVAPSKLGRMSSGSTPVGRSSIPVTKPTPARPSSLVRRAFASTVKVSPSRSTLMPPNSKPVLSPFGIVADVTLLSSARMPG